MKFQPGNKAGKQFTSTNQPRKAGRKPALYKQLVSIVNKEVNLQFSKEDFIKLHQWLLERTNEELSAIYKNPEMPIFIAILIRAILQDAQNGTVLTIDRVIGKNPQPIQVDQLTENNYNHFDFKKLSDEELDMIGEIIDKLP